MIDLTHDRAGPSRTQMQATYFVLIRLNLYQKYSATNLAGREEGRSDLGCPISIGEGKVL